MKARQAGLLITKLLRAGTIGSGAWCGKRQFGMVTTIVAVTLSTIIHDILSKEILAFSKKGVDKPLFMWYNVITKEVKEKT